MKDVIVFGKPGAGKDTLAKYLVDKYGYTHINMGQILREMAEKGDPDGIKLRDQYWGAGNLVPDHKSGALAAKYIKDLGEVPVVFNGYPRNKGQVHNYFDSLR